MTLAPYALTSPPKNTRWFIRQLQAVSPGNLRALWLPHSTDTTTNILSPDGRTWTADATIQGRITYMGNGIIVTMNAVANTFTTPDTDDLSFTTGPFSGVWFGNVTDSAIARGLLDKYSGSGAREWYFAVDSSDSLNLRLCDTTDTNRCDRTSTTAITQGSPVLLGFSCTETASATAGNNVTLYQNGAVKASTAVNGAGYTAMTGTTSIARVGGSGNIGRILGQQGFGAIYAAALTAAQHARIASISRLYYKVAL